MLKIDYFYLKKKKKKEKKTYFNIQKSNKMISLN